MDNDPRSVRIFSVTKPCANCPFRCDGNAIDLAPGRRDDILNGLLRGGDPTFSCHKTVYRNDGRNFAEEGAYDPTDVSVCAGAEAVLEKIGRNSQIVQIAKRLGVIAPDHYHLAHPQTITWLPTEA
ncbi:MAG: hypothetical protein LAT62_11235 [Natronospirillum sp.]|uniref:hypothetical protein n=1 Tax=Natronospirillum sp. TaxID=2812955 RepID=UPI0025E41857|nr:hypothetical protein [Natronospirillum sp.]MCH8552503.1 hypothetical protein [Natronospirillum sp.]